MSAGLVCIGLTTVDILARSIDGLPQGDRATLIEQIELIPAGTAAGAAFVAATLGVKTALVAAVGNDRAGRFVRMALQEQGVDTELLTVDTALPTSMTLLTINSAGQHPNFHAVGASSFMQVTPAAVAAACSARFVHWAGIGGPKLDGGPGAALLQAARAAGATITCDLIAPQPTALDELKRLLPHVDYFMPSVSEAFALAGTNDLATAASFYIDLGARACIFKNGAAGSYLALGRERVTLRAHEVAPVDTTSCGDSYCAGFIAALDRGWSVVEACRFATTVAALVAQGLGTLGALRSFEATETAMREMPLREVM